MGGWFLFSNRDEVDEVDYTPVANSTTTGNNSGISTSTGIWLNNLKLIGTPASSSEIVIDKPAIGNTISSPLSVSGKARGGWYFEASAPVNVIDSTGKVLGQGFVTAEGEWMTSEFVPFSGIIRFTPGTATSGAVVFMNDNPSGDAIRAKYLAIPVLFK